ncbi:transcriptional regulator GutM [Hutsoniella sourekii]|uniref:transcriptional regulator GutM n=1 Tax=Hutsoniella sourekii TaxID=87650 RepID=UPI00048914C7|nr:transcriptional regulator GutM [Hutsoniella sourekii]
MSFLLLFAIIAIGAYVIQFILGYYQIKHFNQNYVELRRKGRVAIGRKPGRIQAGTIVMFAIDDQDRITDTRLLQGVTVLSKFRDLPQYAGQDIHFIDKKHPLVQRENRLTQIAMEDARDLFIRFEMGEYKEEPKASPIGKLSTNINVMRHQLKNKVKGRV